MSLLNFESLKFSTGSLALDLSLPQGGIVAGEIVLISGPPESGKTALALTFLAQVKHLPTIFLDLDGGLERQFALAMGVNGETCLFSRPNGMEQAFEFALHLVRSGELAILVIDGFGHITPESDEIRQESVQADYVLDKRRLATLLPSLQRICQEARTTLVLCEHHPLRPGAPYHALQRRMAKLGLRLRCDIRIELGPLSSNEPRLARKGLGIQIQRILLKSIAKPSEVKYPILMNLMYNQGVEQSSEIVDLGLKLGLIRNQEAACIYQGQSLGRNQQEAIHFLREHPELTRQIERDIRKSLHLFHNSV